MAEGRNSLIVSILSIVISSIAAGAAFLTYIQVKEADQFDLDRIKYYAALRGDELHFLQVTGDSYFVSEIQISATLRAKLSSNSTTSITMDDIFQKVKPFTLYLLPYARTNRSKPSFVVPDFRATVCERVEDIECEVGAELTVIEVSFSVSDDLRTTTVDQLPN